MMSGLFVFEGPDEVGKTTLVSAVADFLTRSGCTNLIMSFPGKEVGTLGRHIYELHHAPSQFGLRSLTPLSLQLLHVAAHIDNIETRILPAIAAKSVILLDRFWWSTWVYGRVAGISPEALREIIAPEYRAWNGIQPTTLFLLTRQLAAADSRLLAAYEELKEIESIKYDIALVENDAKVSELAMRVGGDILNKLGTLSQT